MMRHNNRKKQSGFTLIELLVVIAVIGILAAVVLASLQTARNKGSDAATKADLDNMRAEAELYYDANNGYSASAISGYPAVALTGCIYPGTVFADTTIVSAVAGITKSSGTSPICALTGTSGAQASGWAMSAVTKTFPTSTWCVDSTGVSVPGKVANTGICS